MKTRKPSSSGRAPKKMAGTTASSVRKEKVDNKAKLAELNSDTPKKVSGGGNEKIDNKTTLADVNGPKGKK